MSGLRRSRPDEQDASLKKLQEISFKSRQEPDSPAQATSSKSTASLEAAEQEPYSDGSGERETLQNVSKESPNPPAPPVLKVCDTHSSSDTKSTSRQSSTHGELEIVTDQNPLRPTVTLVCPTKEAEQPVSPTRSPNYYRKNISSSPVLSKSKTSPVLQKMNTLSAPPTLTSRLVPPVSPKLRTRSEADTETSGKSKICVSPIPSPTLQSRKYFKMYSSPVLATNRRGSEPIVDSKSRGDFQQMQVSVTDRRWERLRSILVAMKDEPFDVEESLQSSQPDLLSNMQEKINAQEEQFALEKELSVMQEALRQKELELQQAEAERDSALRYIRQTKMDMKDSPSSPDSHDVNVRFYEQGIESLRAAHITKENVLELFIPMMQELQGQRSYLDRLMTVVLMRAPWMLDEVDKVDASYTSSNFISQDDDDDDDDYHYHRYNDSDDEVWC